MPLSIRFTIEGDTQISRRLLIAADAVKDFSQPFAEAAQMLKTTFQDDVFETEGGAIGESWAPLSRAYAYRKARTYGGQGILQATGLMRASFRTSSGPMQAQVWNEAPYFKYHQSNAPRRVIPRRVMMKLDDIQREQVVKIFQVYIQTMTSLENA